MQSNVLWNLLTKLFSFLAIIFLLLAAGLSYASYSGMTENKLAGMMTVMFAAAIAIFAIVAINFINLKADKELKEATEVANSLSNGEYFVEDEIGVKSELLASLQDISSYLKDKTAAADKIADGDLRVNVEPQSDGDIFGKSSGLDDVS